MSKVVVGTRVLVDGKEGQGGVVRYLGNTQFRPGVWAGVELDRPRGKNDGSVEGVRYFVCQPRHGLFLRPEHLSVAPGAAASPRGTNGRPGPDSRNGAGGRGKSAMDEVLYRSMAQLFSFDRDTNGWVDRGIGYASILRHRQSKQVRFLMQEEQSGRALANHMIDPTTRLEENVSSDRAWVFRALDYASGRGVDEVFALQFRTVEAARLFRQCFDKAREHMAALLAAAREVAAAAEQAHQHVSPSRPAPAAAAAPAGDDSAVSEAAVAEAARQMGATSVPRSRARAQQRSQPTPLRHAPPAAAAAAAAGKDAAGEEAEEDEPERHGAGPAPAAPATAAAATGEGASPPDSGGGRARRLRRRLSVVNRHVAAEGGGEDTLEVPAFFQRSSTATVPIYAAVSKKGEAPYGLKKQNQDALVVAEHEPTASILLCVFDGHGEEGHRVSQYLRARIPDAVFQHPLFGEDVGAAMTDAVHEVEQELVEDDCIDCRLSGSTAVMAVVRGRQLTVANVGDSRITLAVGTKVAGRSGKTRTVIKAEAVSHDHKPESPQERARIEEAGGRVFAIDYGDGEDGPQRVWLGDADLPGLAMARSVGDVVAKWAGVISMPEITTRTLASTDKFLVLASDGLWEFMEDQEVVDMIHKSSGPNEALQALLDESKRRWTAHEPVTDDTSIVIAALKV